MADDINNEPFPWHLGVFDAHCHPTDTMSSIPSIPSMKTRALTVMATRAQDQDLVADIASKNGIRSRNIEQWDPQECIIPSFPDPMSFFNFLSQTRSYLQKYPLALVGEIGLDRAFRVPEPWKPGNEQGRDSDLTPGGREGRELSPWKVDVKHQKRIFKMQLQLAAEMGRAVSIHGVSAVGILFETLKELYEGYEKKVLSRRERKKLDHEKHVTEWQPENEEKLDGDHKKPYPPRVCLHSYTGSAAHFKQYLAPTIPVEVFASFSTAINLSDDLEGETKKEFADVVMAVPDHLLLVESDLHTAGEDMDRRMEDVVRRVCKIKKWGLEDGVKRLAENWSRFVFGGEG
ncbi:Metallo-dependent hydrolase [Lindgomyces ingoldianus]|uniref:Metallo-dependent hydrolase n=1 Tax=Lindgomyces ingoldianus TaxID=673940 RepID=A0ACB6R178_9PLEO|nr:Metallo-dependent hydrolase [Lindgomyces ingoldianus]KAF2472936.1 Metallo-dependent hydrolase [Lindgomyces ingoldianus]